MKKTFDTLIDKKASLILRGIAILMVIVSHYAEWWVLFFEVSAQQEAVRSALTRLGVYGVDIFFLCSGYASVKALGGKPLSGTVIWKRIRNLYIPYLLTVGVIELLIGGFTSLKDFGDYLTGHDYWFMSILFLFNIVFFAIWGAFGSKIFKSFPWVQKAICISLLFAFTFIFSQYLYQHEYHDFWYLSNFAFVIGVIGGECERQIVQGLVRLRWLLLLLGGIATGWIFWLDLRFQWYAVLWVIGILSLTAGRKWQWRGMEFVGQRSLYYYLVHTIVFMYCMNHLEMFMAGRIMIALAATGVAGIGVDALLRLLMAGRKKIAGAASE